MEYDVVIVGAGPAGSTAARFCARKGLRTRIIEKARFPRYKPCGGCLSPRVLRKLDFDIGGVIQGTVSEVRFTFQLEDPFSIACQDPMGYLVVRESFDTSYAGKPRRRGQICMKKGGWLDFGRMEKGLTFPSRGGIRSVPLPDWGRWGPQHRFPVTPRRGDGEGGHGLCGGGLFAAWNTGEIVFCPSRFWWDSLWVWMDFSQG